jgi:hypothetical protein
MFSAARASVSSVSQSAAVTVPVAPCVVPWCRRYTLSDRPYGPGHGRLGNRGLPGGRPGTVDITGPGPGRQVCRPCQ